MTAIPSNYRNDEQLDAILAEVGHWAINGRQGNTLGFAPSLRVAIDRAAGFAASGAVVIALTRLPSDNIIVFEGQIGRLRKLIEGRERVSVVEPDAWLETKSSEPAAAEAISMGTKAALATRVRRHAS